jgi:hypothetical protein
MNFLMKVFNFFFGPKFKVGDIIIHRLREPWEENLPIKILEVGKSSYRALIQYRLDKIYTRESTIPFEHEFIYKKDNK